MRFKREPGQDVIRGFLSKLVQLDRYCGLLVVRSSHITFVRITETLYFLGGKHRNINSKTETIIDPTVPTGFSIYLL